MDVLAWAESPLWERRLAVLLCHSHSASRGAAIPQSSLGRCCFTIAIALRAVLLCHSHCASRCAATPQSSHHAVLLCHSHRFARCWCSTDTALRAVLLCYATVIASRGAGSLTRLGGRVVRYRVVGCGGGRLM